MPFTRDPVSVLWEGPAARILERAYEAGGAWFGTRIVDPSPRQLGITAEMGIRVDGPDRVPGRRARTRWARAFVRAIERANREAGKPRSIEWEVGRHIAASPGGGRPAGRAFRIRTHPGGQAARDAARRKADSARIYDDAGFPAGAWSDPELRDW